MIIFIIFYNIIILNMTDTVILTDENIDTTGITFGPPINNAIVRNQIVAPLNNSTLENNIMTHNKHSIFKPLPNTGKGPVGNFYAEIHWDNGFAPWHLVRFSTPMDGNCLFHAISNSFFIPYHEEMLH